jgi:adenylate cyclase
MEKDLRWIAGNALNNIFANKQFAGEPRGREVLADLGLMRDLHAGAFSSMNVLIVETQGLYFTGEFEKGVAVALKAVEIGSAAGNKWAIRYAEIQLIQHYVELGRLEDARPLLGITYGERQRDYAEAMAIIRFHLAEGDPAKGLDAARLLAGGDAGPIQAEIGVRGLIATGAVDEANAGMVKFDHRRPWLGKTPYVLLAHARLALAEGNHSTAMQHAQPALESFQSVDYKPDVARTHLVLAEAHAATDVDRARKHVELAAGIATAIGSVAIRRDAEKLMERLGGELQPAPPQQVKPSEDGPLGERLVTVLFADVRGYTAIASASAPADLSDRISALQRWAMIEIDRHHGAVDKFAGDAMMATFNVSGASVDHCLHALQTALALRDKAAMLGLPLGVGIATGAAVVGRMAGGANVSVLGEATNLASRLQAQAAAGEVLLSDESNRRVAVWLSERGMGGEPVRLTLRGIEGETLAYRLGAPAELATA